MRTLLRLVLAAGLALGGGAAVSAPAHAAACSTTGSGVTVVVTTPGSGTSVRCAGGDPSSAWGALSSAGYSVTPVQRFPGAVCRISGYPASDPCVNMPPSTAYWAFFHAQRGGGWTYSQTGIGSYNPAPGSVVGFSFGSGGAPGVAPPAPPVAPKPSTTSPTPKPSTTSPKPRPSTTSPKPRSSTSSTSRSTTTNAQPRPSSSSTQPSVVVTQNGTTTRLPVVTSSTGTATVSSSTTATASSGTTSSPGSTSTSASTAGGESVNAANTSASTPASTPWSLVAGVLAIIALAVTAFAARRRRATH